jgi:hypothetical protein
MSQNLPNTGCITSGFYLYLYRIQPHSDRGIYRYFEGWNRSIGPTGLSAENSSRGRSSVWLERLPVTQKVAGSSPVGPAPVASFNRSASGSTPKSCCRSSHLTRYISRLFSRISCFLVPPIASTFLFVRIHCFQHNIISSLRSLDFRHRLCVRSPLSMEMEMIPAGII